MVLTNQQTEQRDDVQPSLVSVALFVNEAGHHERDDRRDSLSLLNAMLR
jgi:hypothetical protein